jgi:hypothetical protein
MGLLLSYFLRERPKSLHASLHIGCARALVELQRIQRKTRQGFLRVLGGGYRSI